MFTIQTQDVYPYINLVILYNKEGVIIPYRLMTNIKYDFTFVEKRGGWLLFKKIGGTAENHYDVLENE